VIFVKNVTINDVSQKIQNIVVFVKKNNLTKIKYL